MKKILILVASITVISCQDNVPKCNDPEVLKIIYSVINENKDKMTFDAEIFGIMPYGNKKELTSENLEITNLLTKSKDAELSSCGCEGKLTIKNISEENTVLEGLIEYTAQKDTENNIIVKVENLSTLKVVK